MRGTVDNYLVYLITGVIPWVFFTGNSQGMASIRSECRYYQEGVFFKRNPAFVSGFCWYHQLFHLLCHHFGFLRYFRSWLFSWHLLLLPIAALLQFLICLGLTLAFSAINIYIKGCEYIINFGSICCFTVPRSCMS